MTTAGSGWDPPEVSDRGSDSTDLAARFRAAWTDPGDAATAIPELLPVRLTRACVTVLPIDGAGLSLIERDVRVPLGASDETASRAERLQFTFGEGPCLEASQQQRIQVADTAQLERRWPSFAQDLFEHTPYRATIALPLTLSAHTHGALDLFVVDPAHARSLSLADAATISERIVEALAIARAITGSEAPRWSDDAEPAWLRNPGVESRRLVWVAIGMTMTRLDVTAQDGLSLLRAYAYSHGTVLDEVADHLVSGRLDLAELQT